MSPTPPARGLPRPARVVNELIRAIAVGARHREWTAAERALYGALCEEWMSAVQADMAKAA